MNRQEWEEQVFKSDLNPTARMVCIAIGSHGNWTHDKEVRPSKQRIAGMVGTSRENAGKYVEALEAAGWLKLTQTLKNNVKVYELSTPQVAVSNGILAIKKRGKALNQVVVDDEQVVVSNDKQVAVVNDEVVVSNDTNLQEPTSRTYKEEPTTTSTTDKSAVQLEEVALLEKTTVSPKASFNRRDMIETYIEHTRYLPNVSEEQKRRMRDLMLEPLWSPEESRLNFRAALAIKEVLDSVQV